MFIWEVPLQLWKNHDGHLGLNWKLNKILNCTGFQSPVILDSAIWRRIIFDSAFGCRVEAKPRIYTSVLTTSYFIYIHLIASIFVCIHHHTHILKPKLILNNFSTQFYNEINESMSTRRGTRNRRPSKKAATVSRLSFSTYYWRVRVIIYVYYDRNKRMNRTKP